MLRSRPADEAAAPASFDTQAATFDLRAGFPPPVRRQIAADIIELAGLKPGERLADLGAGTGTIGLELLTAGVAYVGVDQSPRMLEVFQSRAPSGPGAEFIVADLRDPWPLAPGSVRAFFGSRSLHWLSEAHVVSEADKAGDPAGYTLVVGRVARDRESLRSRMRRRMHELLDFAGLVPRRGDRALRALGEACVAAGATPLPLRICAEWQVTLSPRSILDAWRSKAGLGGVALAPKTQAGLLSELEVWTLETIGHIDTPLASTERYELSGFAFGARQNHEE